jgi:outer membrane protein OmpA-like peptidoglycan-associated protein
MINRRILVVCCLLLCLHLLHSEVFRFKHSSGEKYHIITEVIENVYINGRFNNRAEILNKISVEVKDVRGTSGLLYGLFQVSERAWGASGPYRLTDEVFRSVFWRDELGKYEIEPSYLMPIVRNIPLFPEKDLKPQESWAAKAEEVHDLRNYGIEEPFSIPLDVFYTYLGTEKRDAKELAVFDIQYSASRSLRGISSPDQMAPVKIRGNSHQTYYWDVEEGRPYMYQDRFDYIYLLSDGRYIEFEGSSRGQVIQAERLDKEAVAGEIQKEIEEKGLEDTDVKVDEEGITITLENINFPPDSAYLWPEERKKLDKIAEILQRYPDRDLLIVGHTALAGTEAGRKKLSEDRARAVGEYLLSKDVRKENQIMYRGMGAAQPIADNQTEAGRRRNRRVEIKILEN